MIKLILFILFANDATLTHKEITTSNCINFIKGLSANGHLDTKTMTTWLDKIITSKTFINPFAENFAWTDSTREILYKQMELFTKEDLDVEKIQVWLQKYLAEINGFNVTKEVTIDQSKTVVKDELYPFFLTEEGVNSLFDSITHQERYPGLNIGRILGLILQAHRLNIISSDFLNPHSKNTLIKQTHIDKLLDAIKLINQPSYNHTVIPSHIQTLKKFGYKGGIPLQLYLFNNMTPRKADFTTLQTKQGVQDFFDAILKLLRTFGAPPLT